MSLAPLHFDADLIRRHDRPGPRYTSYPTAVQFSDGFDEQAYRRAALLSNDRPARPLSAYLHVPFCAQPCFYCGCNKIITRNPQHIEDYLRRLFLEIELQGGLFEQRRELRQMHFGGGTPTCLSNAQMANVLEELQRNFSVGHQAEFSIEVDPRTLQPGSLAELSRMGFNRLSLGVQDLDARVQKAVNRVQSTEQIAATVEEARALGFRSISFDLIYGLPLQTPASFQHTLEQVIQMRPDRVCTYAYAHLPRMFRAQRAIREDQLPSAETRLALLGLSVQHLTNTGYDYLGMDHFALPEDDLAVAAREGRMHRNFQGYSTHQDCDLIGIGVSSIGAVGECYIQNRKQLRDYYEDLDRGRLPVERGLSLSMDDIIRREIIQDIMCRGAVSPTRIEASYALDFDSYFADELQQLQGLSRDGLLDHCDHERIQVSARGRALLRTVAMVFDAHLRSPQEARQYSKVI